MRQSWERLGAGIRLAVGLILVWAVQTTALLAKGGLFLGKHEGDAMHLVEIVLRQAAGQWPHLDFMTPIGMLATAPIALFTALGWGVGQSILLAQALVGLILLPAVWWVGVSRMRLGWALPYGVVILVLVLAVVHGEAERSLSISMHYNRWGWALAFLAIGIAVLPPVQRQSGAADGLVLGLVFAALGLVKVTYLVAFLPTVVLALSLRRDGRALLVALATGLAVVALLTVLAGPAIWPAYFGDLLAVSASAVRSNPGDTLAAVVAAPAYLGGSLVALAGVILLRQAGQQREGLLLLTLLPGFFYVTFQNFGNDPQWLYLLGVLLLVLRPAPGSPGANRRQALALAGCVAFALALPSAVNLASSPFRHLTVSAAGYTQLLPRATRHSDIHFTTTRAERVAGRIPLDSFPVPDTQPALLNGVALPECQLDAGTVRVFDAIARRLEAAGLSGRRILTADLFSSLWLFGDFPPLRGGAPWYYGGLPGGAEAELLLVPTCPVLPKARRVVLEQIAERGWILTELAHDPAFVVLDIQRP